MSTAECTRCRLDRKLRKLLTPPGGTIAPELDRLREALVRVDRPDHMLDWVHKPHVRPVLDDLVTRLADGRETRGRSLLGVPSPWLFPGSRPGSALTEDALAQRPHAIGISPRQGRSAALFALAAEVPAAILARTLGIHVQVAVQWQKISAGDWTAYAADVSRRSSINPGPAAEAGP
jgi:hypothetical protein